jgi:hypothetical protein
MALMDNLDHTERAPLAIPLVRRAPRSVEAPPESQQAECACPELCQLDHGN